MKVAIILKAPAFSDEVLEENVIYADGAYKFKDKVGEKNVLAVVGDFDSIDKVPTGENLVKLNPEKDFTDGERAVRLAKEKGADEIVIYGGYGGKIEHILGNLALLKIAKNMSLNASIMDGQTKTQLISGKVEIPLRKGSKVSLIPYGGQCSFVKSKGLYYSLDGLTLTTADTVGISNIALKDKIEIEISKGEALLVYEKN